MSQVDVLPMGNGPKNPHGNGFYAQETDLNTTTEVLLVLHHSLWSKTASHHMACAMQGWRAASHSQ